MKWKHRDVVFSISPTLLAVFVIGAILGYAQEIAFSLLALLFHEGGHLVAAWAADEPIESFEMLPFGAVIRLCEKPQSSGRAFLIAAGGPFASLLAATLAAGIAYFFPATADLLRGFVDASLLLAAVNLIPAVPLDGGRMLRAMLAPIVSEKTGKWVCAILGLTLAALLLYLGAYAAFSGEMLPIPFLLALFLILGGVKELRNGDYAAIVAVARRGGRMNASSSVRLQTVAMLSNVKARDALRRLRGASLVAVMDGSMQLLGTLSEGDILAALISRGADVTLGAIVRGQ